MSILRNIFARKRVFLDYASTTPVSREVSKVMHDAEKFFANPSSLYSEAILVKEKIKEAKKSISNILNCQSRDIFFTSGGTEGNNLALMGIFKFFKNANFVPHFIVSNIEHPSVLEVCSEIEKLGGEVTYVNSDEFGLVNPKDVESSIKDNTVLISIMYANNEIGTIQPIKEIGRIIKEYRRKNEKEFPYFHSDASQASLYLSVNVLKLNLDLMTLDGIKMYGPRGSGILFKRQNIKISPLFFGGGQESGLRSGTENLPSILGLAKALEVAHSLRENESKRLTFLRDFLIKEIEKNFPNSSINGSRDNRLPNNVNICFPGIDSEFITISLDINGISCSYSSSCRTLKEDSSSYVISALNKEDCKMSSLRFTFGRETKKSDLVFLIDVLKKVVK